MNLSVNHYDLCQKYRGRAVQIRTVNGKVHNGIIHRVAPNRVYLRPLENTRSLGGYGYGYYRGYGGWGWGWGLALASIAAIALLPFFFW